MDNKITVLYVDDEPINLMLFSINFKGKFNVITAESGKAGLEILRKNQNINVLISDMRMPGMNGIDFIRQAKVDFPTIICFILTGFDITEEITEALDSKLIHRYFSKPFKIDEIERSIVEIID